MRFPPLKEIPVVVFENESQPTTNFVSCSLAVLEINTAELMTRIEDIPTE